MTTATLPPPTIRQPIPALPRPVSAIGRVQNTVGALPAPALTSDTVIAATVGDLASTHVIDARTLAVVARKDRYIQPIAAMITEHLLGVTVTVVRSAITVTLA